MKKIDIKKFYSDRNLFYMVMIELTSKCNYRCKHCYIDSNNRNNLSYIEVCKLLDELRKIGVYEIQFTGGEIFLLDYTMDILKYARKLFFKVSILTNLSLVSDKHIEELNLIGVENVSTTLFSMKDNINDSITGGKGSATRVIDNCIKMSKTTNINVEIKTVVMKANVNEYKDIERFCRKNNIKFLATEGLFPSLTGITNPRVLGMDYENLKNNIESLDKIRFGSIFEEKKTENTCICCELHYSLFIDAKGDIYPCNLWFHKLGNIKENNLEEVWNNKFLNKIRTTKWKDLNKCWECSYKNNCIRCSGIIENITGNYLSIDKNSCMVARIRNEIKSL